MLTKRELGHILIGIGFGAIIMMSVFFLIQSINKQDIFMLSSAYLTGILGVVPIIYGTFLIKKYK